MEESPIFVIYSIIFFIILIILTIGMVIKFPKAKKEYKEDAYRLLKKQNPDPKEIKETINALNIYLGRWSKDEEAAQLINRLMDKLSEIPK